MGDLSIFKERQLIERSPRDELSPLAKTLFKPMGLRRIQTSAGGSFKRMVNGEQVGKAIKGDFNAIVVGALPDISRTYYKAKYDPDADPTLPDCWSNLGDKPEAAAPHPQHATCNGCPQQAKGSGEGGRAACRLSRRVAILLEGDSSGELYQINIPAKSLFGKGSGSTHPFESYKNFLASNGYSIDDIITQIAYDEEADTMQMHFTPVRFVTDEEATVVAAAQANPDIERYIRLVAAQADNVTKLPPAAEPEPEPVVVPKMEAAVVPKKSVFDDDEAPATEPKKRGRPRLVATEETAAKPDIASTLARWASEEDEDA